MKLAIWYSVAGSTLIWPPAKQGWPQRGLQTLNAPLRGITGPGPLAAISYDVSILKKYIYIK